MSCDCFVDEYLGWDVAFVGRHTCGLSGSGCGVGGWYIGCWRSVRTVEKAARDDLEVCILVARVTVDNIVLDIVYLKLTVDRKEHSKLLKTRQTNHRGGITQAKLLRGNAALPPSAS